MLLVLDICRYNEKNGGYMQKRDRDYHEIPEYKRKTTIQVSKRSEPVKKWQLAALILVIIIFLIAGAVMAFGYSMLNNIHKIDDTKVKYAPTDIVENATNAGVKNENISDKEHASDLNKEELLQDTAVVSPEVQSLEDQVINLLLIGEEGIYDDDLGRSDSSMILTINKEQKTLKLTSLMRDILVKIPGYLDNKLNAAYHNGGGKLLSETVEKNFGIQVDGYVIVDFQGFEDIIDALGGVEIELTQAEAEYLNTHNYISKKKYRNVVPGKQILNGNQALGYCRIRYVISSGNQDGDFGRTERQRRVLLTLFEKYKSQNPVEMVKIAKKLLGYVSTNLNNTEILSYVTEAAMLGCNTIDTINIPVEGSYIGGTAMAGLYKRWVFQVDWDITRAELVNFIYGSSHIEEMGADPGKLISTDSETAAKEEKANKKKRLASSGYGTKGKVVNQADIVEDKKTDTKKVTKSTQKKKKKAA